MSVPDSICRDFTEYVGTRTNSRDRTEFVGTQERLPGIEKICQEVRKMSGLGKNSEFITHKKYYSNKCRHAFSVFKICKI